MSITNLSHFGLTEIGRTADNIILEGTEEACKRIAFAHGLEIVAPWYPTIRTDCAAGAVLDCSRIVGWNLTRGFILRADYARDSYHMLIPMQIWEEKIIQFGD
jgi:hypothetical protein